MLSAPSLWAHRPCSGILWVPQDKLAGDSTFTRLCGKRTLLEHHRASVLWFVVKEEKAPRDPAEAKDSFACVCCGFNNGDRRWAMDGLTDGGQRNLGYLGAPSFFRFDSPVRTLELPKVCDWNPHNSPKEGRRKRGKPHVGEEYWWEDEDKR
ncbi:hypothetical protein GW17_00012114 [Ensete ventricosum]|uniref:Uncharacterized protein n=1 Tax=Ensete ventricosum TaxID=4639 RepID=A0A444FLY5_ENSVE|nr:hypothetical protein GW17_00012114 [Ensete ventricosum]RZR71313.1 hypothetical protein BHM03_00004602 [Ensete ventricosum]